MVTFHIHFAEVGIYLAILLRISTVLFLIPIFSSAYVPGAIKSCLAIALATMVYFLPHQAVAPLNFDAAFLLPIVVGEIIFGMTIGLSILMVIGAFQFAGELISFQMGFGFAQVADPQSGNQMAFLSGWFQLLVTLILFALNGHHVILRALVESFRTIPVGGFILGANTFSHMFALSAQMLVIGIKVAAPVMAALLLTQVGLGLVSKFAPQINILAASFPLTIMLGFIFLGVSVSIWGNSVEFFLEKLFHFLHGIARGF